MEIDYNYNLLACCDSGLIKTTFFKMKILFQAPTFSNNEAKAEFLGSLQQLPAYEGEDKMGSHILLELNSETIKFESIKQLSYIFKKWGIDQSPIESLYKMMSIEGY